jgi:hypothetical protein
MASVTTEFMTGSGSSIIAEEFAETVAAVHAAPVPPGAGDVGALTSP